MTPISCPSRSTWTRAQICTHWGGGSPPLRIVQSDVRNTVYPTLLKLGFLMNQPGETGEAESPRQRLPTLPLSFSSEPVLHMSGGGGGNLSKHLTPREAPRSGPENHLQSSSGGNKTRWGAGEGTVAQTPCQCWEPVCPQPGGPGFLHTCPTHHNCDGIRGVGSTRCYHLEQKSSLEPRVAELASVCFHPVLSGWLSISGVKVAAKQAPFQSMPLVLQEPREGNTPNTPKATSVPLTPTFQSHPCLRFLIRGPGGSWN